MASKSYPWPRGVAADSLVGYTAKEWYAAWLLMAQAGGVVVDASVYSDATLYNRGVWYSSANRLEVTSPGANRINVASGAALVDGAMFYNTASIGAGADVGSPAANPRIDRVVIRKNFGALPYTPAAASVALFSVPAYTARVTVIHGAENVAPVAPTLTQDTTRATYWDIPLFQYQIAVGGAITVLTDQREYVDAVTKYKFIHPVLAYNRTLTAEVNFDVAGAATSGYTAQLILPDLNECSIWGTYIMPEDYAGGAAVGAIVTSPAAGNLWRGFILNSDAMGVIPGTGSTVVPAAAEAILANVFNYVTATALPATAAGNIIGLDWTRYGDNGGDTIANIVRFHGWRMSYIGWR